MRVANRFAHNPISLFSNQQGLVVILLRSGLDISHEKIRTAGKVLSFLIIILIGTERVPGQNVLQNHCPHRRVPSPRRRWHHGRTRGSEANDLGQRRRHSCRHRDVQQR